jgi:hypothetical protein
MATLQGSIVIASEAKQSRIFAWLLDGVASLAMTTLATAH